MEKKSLNALKRRLTGFSNLCLLIGFLLGSQLLFGAGDNNTNKQDETKVITGKVTDSNTGEALPGVSIAVKGTNKGTISDPEGNFSLSASPTDILVFSYVGYLDEEITVGTSTTITVVLVQDLVGIDEVVVVGYGVQKKKLITGATVQVKEEDIVKSNNTRLESSLQGLTPGMVIVKQSGQPGSDFNITIRGIGSVNGSTPLVLIDGVPGNLNTLNPSDVQSVDILKDAASAAIYGSRAADGVILITTKKGATGKMQVSYDFYYGVANSPKKVEMLNAREYATILNEQAINIAPTRNPPFTEEYVNSLGEGTDWQEEAYHKNAPIQNHYLGINGGNDISTYSASLSYSNEKGIFDYQNKSEYERMGFRLNSEHKVKNFLKIGENLTYTHRYRTGLGVGGIYDNFMRNILSSSPLIDAYDENVYDGFGRSDYVEEQINPIAVMNYSYNSINRNDDIVGDIYAEIEIIPGLKFRTDFGGTLNFSNNSSATDTFNITNQNYNEIPDYTSYMSRNFGYNWDNYFTYDKSIGKHNFLLMAGTNAQDNNYYNMDTQAEAFLKNPNLPPLISNIELRPGLSDTIRAYGSSGKGDSRFSIYGRLSYNYNEKYMFTYSYRRDASSRFGAENRVGNFHSFSGGWVVTKESFMESSPWLTFLKLRGSWGQNGKEPYRAGAFLATVGSYQRQSSIGSGWQTGMSPDIMANPTLQWEAATQLDIGFDARFLQDFSLNVDLYNKTYKDWIIPKPVPGISGRRGISEQLPLANSGNAINQGVEVELGYAKTFGALRLTVNANGAFNKNKVTDVPGEIIPGSGSILYNGSEEFYRVQEGYPMGFFFGYKTDGLFQTQEEADNYVNAAGVEYQDGAAPGDVKRIDVNGDSVIDADDKVMLGNPHPDFVYGFNISLEYKGFDFSMNILGAAGNQIVKCYRDESRDYYNYTSEILDRWQWVDANDDGIVQEGEGTSNSMPRVTGGKDRNQNWRKFSNLYIEDADFLKIKTVNLGYDFKNLWKNAPVGQFRLYVSATNLLTITKYTGLDPEVGYGSFYNNQGILTDAYASGIDIGFYPAAQTYLVGLNIKF